MNLSSSSGVLSGKRREISEKLLWISSMSPSKISLKENVLFIFKELPNNPIVNMQTDWISRIYAEIKKTRTSPDETIIHGNIIVLRSILSCSLKENIFQDLQDISEYILNHRNNKNAFIQIAVIESLPYLARFDTGIFCVTHLKTCLTFLLSFGLNSRNAEKKICYETLANLFNLIDSSFLKEDMSKIMSNITAELSKEAKPFCPEIIKCVDVLRIKFGKKLADYVNMNNLLALVIFNGLHSQTLEFLNEICALGERDPWWQTYGQSLQLKMLMTISAILSGRVYNFAINSPSIQQEDVVKFTEAVQGQLTASPDFRKIDSVALALQALATFDFHYYADSMALFVKDVVLEYLENDSPVIRKAAANAGSLLYIRQTSKGDLVATKQFVDDILEKFLSVCLGDPDNSVRETMLFSLNENFDVFLNNQRYLKMLFTCLHDPVFKVQENSLRIICRLVKYDPSEIVPYIKKKIFQSLNALNYEFIQKEKEKIEILNLLTCIIENAPSIISPHVDTICLTTISMLNDPSTSNNLIPHLLNVLTQLSNAVKQQLLCYLKDFFPIIIQCMQDMSYSTKREIAIKTVTHLIKNTGYVILPYYKYPNLLDTLLYLLKNETNVDIRMGLLKLMGSLGALDAYYYKKIQLRLADTRNVSFDEIIGQDFKSPFIIIKKLKKAEKLANQPKKDLIKFYNDLIFVQNIDKKKPVQSAETFQTRSLLNAQLKSEERANNEKSAQKTTVLPVDIEEILNAHITINVNNPEYLTTVVIKALLKVLCDSTLNQFHTLAVDALSVISSTLKLRFANFLHIVIPVFAHLVHTDLNLRELLIHHLEKIIKLCGPNFQEQYVNSVLELVLVYVADPKGKLMGKCFETLTTLIFTSKKHLRYKMELITTKLNHIISSFDDAKEIVKSIVFIYSNLSDLLDTYLEHIISLLTRIITTCSLSDLDSLSTIITFFNICITTCPSTIQYSSKIVQALAFILDHYPPLHNLVVNSYVNMMIRFKNSVLILIPLMNSSISRHKINHKVYNSCIQILLNQGGLQDIELYLDTEIVQAIQNHASDSIQSRLPKKSFAAGANADTAGAFPVRPTDNDLLLAEFNTSHKNLEEDWTEWMRKSSLELLKQSPYPVIYACHSVAELYPPIARELYNVAFVSCWSILNDKQKETMIKMLNNAIHHQNTPINILQTILNLAEFMQHDREVIPIDISVLGDLAERCLAYAKALYYRELEFEVSPESTIESLVALYTNLGHSEAANGLLVYAKNTLNIELKMSWYENLQRWDEALLAYNAKEKDSGQDFFVGKMRCLSAMSDWESLINNCDPVINGSTSDMIEKRKQVIQLGANAALNLNQWDKLEKYTEKMDDDKSFFQAIVSLRQDSLPQANAFIKKTREVLDSKVSGLLLESYSRAYDNVIKLQQLSEMEEIIDYREEQYRLVLETDEIKQCSPEKFHAKIEAMFAKNKVANIPSVKVLKSQLIEKWNDRLNGCQPSIDVWQQVLSVRSVLLSRYENLEAWIKFCKLCMKQNQIQICKRTLEIIKEEVFKFIPDEEHMPPKLMLVSIECEYASGTKDPRALIHKVCNYLDKQTGIDEIKSKYYLKLGHILKREQEEMSTESIKEVITYYDKAVEHNKNSYKAWHCIGLMNFEAVEYYQNINDRSQRPLLLQHVIASLQGLIKTISLGTEDMGMSVSFQDTLRLLTLWFNYGDDPRACELIRDAFSTLDITSWIEVVPQLIARFDIPNKTIQNLIHTLLMFIGRSHPQALIYPLAVSLKEKMSARKTAAIKIFEDMKLKYPELIDQALLISEELCRAAILLKEQWADGIEEACKQYFQEKNPQAMVKTFLELHDLMKNKPQTLSEITFHQSFKMELSEAESWLKRYIHTEDERYLHQAWDIYHSFFKKISERIEQLRTVHLENVSPKLLDMNNTDVSMPGLYKPNKPLIKIAGFAATLQVLTSKQHPRRMLIYGSDGKEYTFLLKGHEDTRQDERVMQLFSLVNRIMSAEAKTKKKDLNITTYSVIPLSTRAGLIGWVLNSDPLQILIREYRENFKIIPNTEMKLLQQMCQKYELLPLANKVEIFRYILDNTKGEDLKKILWLKSPTSEVWLERRTNYTRSLATMSMVGYILGLGDRHPSNIMLQRFTGKIVHIDFGDCFEVDMKREKFPEKVPFRLTRMLIKVMEACSIEGTYRATCEDVMAVLRGNKDSLMAVLQAFVYDPLVNWRLLTPSDAKVEYGEAGGKGGNTMVSKPMATVAGGMNRSAQKRKTVKEIEEVKEEQQSPWKRNDSWIRDIIRKESTNANDEWEREIQAQFQEDEANRPIEILNQRALEVVDRIKKKLTGRDFKEHEVLNVVDQVNQLIRQATSHENICQAFLGWCPFW